MRGVESPGEFLRPHQVVEALTGIDQLRNGVDAVVHLAA
jgi:hypothetical protein